MIIILTSFLVMILMIPLIDCKPFSKDDWKSPPYPDDTYFYSDYKLPAKLITNQIHSPSPQNCPETGKTLCKDVDQYPLEQILDIVKSTNSVNFNFTSIFSDESTNDQQPIINELPAIKSNTKGIKKNETRVRIKLNSNGNSRRSVGSSSLPKQIFDAWKSVHDGLPEVNVNDSPSIVDLKTGNKTEKTVRLGSSSSPSTSTSPSTISKGLNNNNTAVNVEKTYRVRRKLEPSEDNLEKEEICASKTMYITPRAALNDRSEWKFIVNLGEQDTRLKQIIKVEVCLKSGSSCSSSISLPFGYKTRCKQKYIKKKLLALDTNGVTTSTDNFFVPSCCSCQIYREIKKTRR